MWTSLSRIPKPPLYPSLPQKAGSRRGMCSTAGFKAHRNPASFCIMQQNRIWKLYTKWISFLKNHKLPLSLKMLTEMLLNKPYKWASPLAWNASSASLPASPPFTHAHTHTHTHTHLPLAVSFQHSSSLHHARLPRPSTLSSKPTWSFHCLCSSSHRC